MRTFFGAIRDVKNGQYTPMTKFIWMAVPIVQNKVPTQS